MQQTMMTHDDRSFRPPLCLTLGLGLLALVLFLALVWQQRPSGGGGCPCSRHSPMKEKFEHPVEKAVAQQQQQAKRRTMRVV